MLDMFIGDPGGNATSVRTCLVATQQRSDGIRCMVCGTSAS
jgi:hypothetical protein